MSLGIKQIWRVRPQASSIGAARLFLFPRELHRIACRTPRILPKPRRPASNSSYSSSSPLSFKPKDRDGEYMQDGEHVDLIPATRTPGEALIAHLDATPVIPTGQTSILVEPMYEFPHKNETRRSRMRHVRSMDKQRRLEELRQTRLQPLPDWRVVLRHLTKMTPAYEPPSEGQENKEREMEEEDQDDDQDVMGEDVTNEGLEVSELPETRKSATFSASASRPNYLEHSHPYFIRTTADKIPRPGQWTWKSFDSYIRALTFSRIPEGLGSSLYESGTTHTQVVIELLHQTFNDENARTSISPRAFRAALRYMCANGYQDRADARLLYARMELMGLAMDNRVYEIMLESNAGAVKDLANFSNLLALMHRKGCLPRFNTWILFLRLVESDGLRRHILRSMHELRLLDDPRAGKHVAREMAELDTHRAIASGLDTDAFLDQQRAAYGPNWLSKGAANKIIEVLISYGRLPDCRVVIEALAEAPPPALRPNTAMLNTLLAHCGLHNSLRSAIAVLCYLEAPAVGVAPDSLSYTLLFDVARRRRLTLVMSIIWRYASLSEGGVSPRMRRLASEAFMDAYGSSPPSRSKTRVPVFMKHFPQIFEGRVDPAVQDALQILPNGRLRDSGTFLGTVASKWYAQKYEGYAPVEPLGVILQHALEVENKALKKREERLRKMREGKKKKKEEQGAAEATRGVTEAADEQDLKSEVLVEPEGFFPVQLRRTAGRNIRRVRIRTNKIVADTGDAKPATSGTSSYRVVMSKIVMDTEDTKLSMSGTSSYRVGMNKSSGHEGPEKKSLQIASMPTRKSTQEHMSTDRKTARTKLRQHIHQGSRNLRKAHPSTFRKYEIAKAPKLFRNVRPMKPKETILLPDAKVRTPEEYRKVTPKEVVAQKDKAGKSPQGHVRQTHVKVWKDRQEAPPKFKIHRHASTPAYDLKKASRSFTIRKHSVGGWPRGAIISTSPLKGSGQSHGK